MYTKEEQRKWGYPEYAQEFDDPEWMTRQLRREMVDPRKNPNLLLSQDHPDFLDNLTRKEYSKAMVRSQDHHMKRKSTWLQQLAVVECRNQARREVVEALEDCPADVQRLVAPILHITAVDWYLGGVLQEAQQLNLPLSDLLKPGKHLEMLRSMRNRIDVGGAAAAEEIMKELEYCAAEVMPKDVRLEVRAVADMGKVQECLAVGYKCKKDGTIEFQEGRFKEAFDSWKEADGLLAKWKAPAHAETADREMRSLHGAILKNLAQAALKLDRWTDALEAAEAALQLDGEDHKAWFRKASALHGLGKIKEMMECLDKIEELAIGRGDQARILKDVQAKRERIATMQDQDDALERRMLERGVVHGIFSSDRASRDTGVQALTAGTAKRPIAGQAGAPSSIATKVTASALPRLDSSGRKRLTRDGAQELLGDLRRAYEDPTLQKQVEKLAIDVHFQPDEFVAYLAKVVLPAQEPVLARWGFDPNERGVREMTRALQDHTQAAGADAQLREGVQEVQKTLYGIMYDHVWRPSDDAKAAAEAAASVKADDSDSEEGLNPN
mmetsp:Transcript_34743/g.79682  ORF Transcript_34743/g.79682 Transcript_34743/m.79682 type:complete len:554 (+) Transcript_34743:99-1760(+)